MKAVISTTYDDKYQFFLPIVIWAWNKLGVEVICFAPESTKVYTHAGRMESHVVERAYLIKDVIKGIGLKATFCAFDAPENKEATYAQVSRLFVGCLDLPMTDEPLITSDIDMLPFGDYLKQYPGDITLFGADLLEGEPMFPICYCSMTHRTWKEVMQVGNKTLQQCLDEQLGHINAEHFRGNYWCFDQELLYKQIQKSSRPTNRFNRSKLPERFATNRLDRDDAFLLERLHPDIVDFHLPRPGYQHDNFEHILKVLTYFYPSENLLWMQDYRDLYVKSLANSKFNQ